MKLFNRQLTIRDLLEIDQGRVQRSQGMKVELVEQYNLLQEKSWFGKLLSLFRSKSYQEFYKVFKYHVKSPSGSTYTVFLKVSPSFSSNKFMTNKVQVFCTCADFKYRAAYDLNKYDNLFLIPATKAHLGEEPLKIAPTKVSTTPVCKHIYAVISYFRTNLKAHDLVY